MNTAEIRPLLGWGYGHRDVLILAGLGLTVLLLAWTVRAAVRSGRPDRWLARLSFLVGFAWSGEAMWEVATQRLHLSHVFVGFAFFLFESQMATAMMRAERHQGLYHHPGKHGRSVWLIAAVAGAIAAMAGDSLVEVVLRLAVPLLVAHQWWVGLTGDGTDRPADAITWTWTPRRILVTVGLARPGAQDLQTVDRQRHIRAIAVVSHRLHSTSWSWRRSWCHARLRRLAMRADDEMLDAARARVERVWQAAERTRPADAGERRLVAVAKAEADGFRAEARAAYAAQAEAVAWAEATARLAEAEAGRRAELEAEVELLRKQAEAEASARQEAEARAGRAEAEAEAAREEAKARVGRAEAEAEVRVGRAEAQAEAARDEARAVALEASRIRGQAEATTADWQRRVSAAEQAAAHAARALTGEQQDRQQAEAQLAVNQRALTSAGRRRQVAESAARRKVEAAEAEVAALREQLAQAQARPSGRTRRAPATIGEPVLFDGVPVPVVHGVGSGTVLAVLQARKEHPEETRKDLARRVQVSDRTVRAVLSAVPDPHLATTGS